MILFHILYNISFIIFYICLICYLFQNSLQLLLINGKFPKAKKLPSGNYFIIFDKGINIYNSHFSLYKTLYNFSDDETIKGEDFEKTAISDFKVNNSYYILCLINGEFLYIFDDYNSRIDKIIINFSNKGKYYNIIPYKYNETSLQDIISFIYDGINGFYYFYFSHFKMNLSFDNFNNTSIYEKSYGNHNDCSNILKNAISTFFYPVQISTLEYGTLTGFFSRYTFCDDIEVLIFADNYNIDNDFQFSKQNYFNFKINNIYDIKSSLPNYEKKCLVCFREEINAYCMIYDIKNNIFGQSILCMIENCLQLDIYLYKENNQYIVICKTQNEEFNHEFKALIFNNNFTQSKNYSNNEIIFSINKCKEIKSYSLMFCYSFIYDCKNYSNQWNIEYNNTLFNFDYCPKNPIDSTLYTSLQTTYYNIFDYTSIPQISTINTFNTSKIGNSNSYSISKSYFSVYSDISTYKEDQTIKNKTDIKKEELFENLSNIINSIEIGKIYEIIGTDFELLIKPTNSTILENSTHVNFSKCENILRKHYNIPSSKILTFLQIEINNTNPQSLTNKVEYQIYDDNKTVLDLSICNDTDIQIFYSLKDNNIDINSVVSFKNSGIDIFNINDAFFNDICNSFNDSNNDVVLEDRINYILN